MTIHQTIRRCIGALFVVLASTPAVAHDYRLGAIEIEHPWTRATPPAASNGAAYLVLRNLGAVADRLLSASSQNAQAVTLHQSQQTNGMMQMRALPDGVALPPGSEIRLEPMGYHLMLEGLKQPIASDRVPLTLVFEKAGRIEVMLVIEAAPGHHEAVPMHENMHKGMHQPMP